MPRLLLDHIPNKIMIMLSEHENAYRISKVYISILYICDNGL